MFLTCNSNVGKNAINSGVWFKSTYGTSDKFDYFGVLHEVIQVQYCGLEEHQVI